MSVLHVTAISYAVPGGAEKLKEGYMTLLEPTRKEEGCLSYVLYQDKADENRFFFHESWETDAHLDAHLESAHIKAFREKYFHLVEKRDLYKLDKAD